jgi:hypothetical protein
MRGNANLRHNIIGIIFLLLVGCTPMAEISIQVIEPAEITLPSYVNQVAFINRSYVPKYESQDTLSFSRKEIYILDTVINNQVFRGLRNGLNESPLFDLDSIHILQFRRNDTNDFLAPLTRDQIRVIKQSEHADALISLEYYRVRDTIDMGTYRLDYVASRRIISHTVWRIYDLSVDSLFDEYMLKDTTNWYVFGEDTYFLIQSLPEFLTSLRTACYNAGLKYGQRISPTWFEVPRYYHKSGGKAMREAGKKAASIDWLGASEIWKKLAYQDNEKIAAKACFNMALVCEMEDILIPAIDWAIKSYRIKQNTFTKSYIDLLINRYEKQKVIKIQLPAEG